MNNKLYYTKKTMLDFEKEIQSTIERTIIFFSKIRIYYTLKIIVEDNEMIKEELEAYLEYLFNEESRLTKNPETDWGKEYKRLRKRYSFEVQQIDRLLYLIPQLLMLEREELCYLINF